MRKRITLNIIFCLILILSAHQSFGQDRQNKQERIEGEQVNTENVVGIIVAPLFESSGSGNIGGELIVNSIAAGITAGVILGGLLIGDLLADTCVSRWHPGDFYYEKNYKIMKEKNIEAWECYNESKCVNKVDMNVVMGVTRSGGGMSFGECRQNCINDVIKSAPTSVAHCARKKTDGYYSDGSYYYYSSSGSGLAQLFNNTHKRRDKYKKNEWQKARDDCMNVASKQNEDFSSQKIYESYNNCLKERGF